VLDFTSALYLGMDHPSDSLRRWSRFTTGVPAALNEPPDAKDVAQQVATLQGCERGLLGSSTFHLFWDLFGMLSRMRVAVYVDKGTYPIARWGTERAAGRGVLVREFAHHEPATLQNNLVQDASDRLIPVVLTDSFCPACGQAAPLRAYLQIVRSYGGRLVVDDTQALGIFGFLPKAEAPYGHGGGGMLRHLQLVGPDLLVISSLAKAFGTPVAVLSGSKKALDEFEANSETRMHCSPPSVPVIRAAQMALVVNREHGDCLRRRLSSLVAHFRGRALDAGFRCTGGLFPVQALRAGSKDRVLASHNQLMRHGIRSVLQYDHGSSALRISFVITAKHTHQMIDRAIDALAGRHSQAPEFANVR
jgi:8-amino-7-oxononanoate synthase